MHRYLQRFGRAFHFAVLWIRARRARCRSDYEKSYRLLESIYRTYGLSMPSEGVMRDVNLLAADVALKADKYDVALAAARLTLRQISQSTDLNPDEKIYLTLYGDSIVRSCQPDMSDDASLACGSMTDPSSLRRENVRTRLKMEYPVEPSPVELERYRAERCSVFRKRCPHCGACALSRLAKPFCTLLRCSRCAKLAKTSIVAGTLFWSVGPPLLFLVLLFASVGQLSSWIFVISTTAMIIFVAGCLLVPVAKAGR